MSTYIPQLDPIPTQHAFFDGSEYHCYETRCMIIHAQLEECYRLYRDDFTYTPILHCSCCGGYYWGSTTHDEKSEEQEIAEIKDFMKQCDEEQAALINEDITTAIKEQEEKDQQEEAILLEEIRQHQGLQNPPDEEDNTGDVTLPNLFTV